MATRGPATVSRSVRALGAAVHDLRTGRHEPNEPRGSRSDLWGAAGEIPAAYPAVRRWRVGALHRPGRPEDATPADARCALGGTRSDPCRPRAGRQAFIGTHLRRRPTGAAWL